MQIQVAEENGKMENEEPNLEFIPRKMVKALEDFLNENFKNYHPAQTAYLLQTAAMQMVSLYGEDPDKVVKDFLLNSASLWHKMKKHEDYQRMRKEILEKGNIEDHS